jgi:hypothetical protein
LLDISNSFFLPITPKTHEEQIEESLPENLRLDAISSERPPSEGWWASRAHAIAAAEEELEIVSEWEEFWPGTV